MRQMNLHAGNTPRRVGADDALRDGRIRRRVLEIYARAAQDWARGPQAIARGFRSARELRSWERRFASEAVYGMVRWRRRLAFQLAGADDAPPEHLYLAWLAAEHPDPQVDAALRAAGLALDPERIERIVDEVQRLAVRESFPDWLARHLVEALGEGEAARLLAALNRRAPLVVRANRLKNDRAELARRLLEEGVRAAEHPLAPDALVLETHLNAYGLQAFKEGRFELQDAGSQLIAELTAPPPRGLVVDACAGAGGKTLALGALLGGKGRLVALDPSERKLVELRDRARRAGLTNARAQAISAAQPERELPKELIGACDRVLVDAPCSGLGAMRRNPEARWRLRPADLEELPRIQRRLLDAFAPLVAPGGRLVYATCTVTPVENDEVVGAFLAAHPRFEEVPAREILGGARARAIGDGTRLRLLPHQHETDGFFAAVMRRQQD